MSEQQATLNTLIGSLSLSQVWTIAGAAIAVVSGSFMAEYKVSEGTLDSKVNIAQVKAAQFEAQLAALNLKLATLEKESAEHKKNAEVFLDAWTRHEEKARFLALFLRHEQSRCLAYRTNGPAVQETRAALSSWVEKNDHSPLLNSAKGEGKNMVLVFFDDTKWTMPWIKAASASK